MKQAFTLPEYQEVRQRLVKEAWSLNDEVKIVEDRGTEVYIYAGIIYGSEHLKESEIQLRVLSELVGSPENLMELGKALEAHFQLEDQIYAGLYALPTPKFQPGQVDRINRNGGVGSQEEHKGYKFNSFWLHWHPGSLISAGWVEVFFSRDIARSFFGRDGNGYPTQFHPMHWLYASLQQFNYEGVSFGFFSGDNSAYYMQIPSHLQ